MNELPEKHEIKQNLMKYILTLLLYFIALHTGYAQQIPHYSQFYANPYLYNPAMAGANNYTNIFALYKNQWTGIPESPKTSVVTFDMPVKQDKMGVGVYLLLDEQHIVGRMSGLATYAYRVSFTENQRLYMGVSAGIKQGRIYFDRMVGDSNDPVILGNASNDIGFDANIGFLYQFKNLEVGFASHQLFAGEYNFEEGSGTSAFKLFRHYVATLQYRFNLGQTQDIYFDPLIMLKTIEGGSPNLSVSGVINWKDKIWGGASYSQQYGIGMMFGILVQDKISIGYAYDYPVGNISDYSSGSHEVTLSYRIYRKGERPERAGDVFRKSKKKQQRYEELLQEDLEKNEKEIRKIENSQRQELKRNLQQDRQEINRLIEGNKTELSDIDNQLDTKEFYVVIGVTKSFSDAEELQTMLKRELDVDGFIRQHETEDYFFIYTKTIKNRIEAEEAFRNNANLIENDLVLHEPWIYGVEK